MKQTGKLKTEIVLRIYFFTTFKHNHHYTRTMAPFRRGMWVWNGYAVASNPATFLAECKKAKITDAYLYFTVGNYTKTDLMRKFIKQLTANGIKAWGLDGARKYFSDVAGPAGLYASIKALIAYNAKVTPEERFYGFQTDNEPDDYSGKYPDTFHVDIPTSKLSKTGGGVYTKTAYQDRMFICRNWINTQKNCTRMLRERGLRSGAALPSWLDDYYGEPLNVNYDGITQTMMAHMFNYIDDYCIMSYQTDLKKVAERVRDELLHGNRMTGKAVMPSLETVKGRGPLVTYGDNATKNSRTLVLQDIATMETMFNSHSSFSGINIHDFNGYMALKP